MGKPLTVKEKDTAVSLFDDATSKQGALIKAMGIRPETFSRVCANALIRNPEIARCTPNSLYEAVFRSCEMGMMPDGKHGAIVPLRMKGKQTAQFWPMIDGLLSKVRQNIPGIALQAHNVFADDEFSDVRGSSPCLTHIPNPSATRTDQTLVASYATAHMPGNDMPEVVVLYKSEMDQYRKTIGPWAQHPLEMYRIRPFKRLLKRLPIGNKLLAFIDDEDGDWGDDDDVEDAWGDEGPAPIDVTPEEKPAPKPAAKKPPVRKKPPPPVQEAPPPIDDDDLASSYQPDPDEELAVGF